MGFKVQKAAVLPWWKKVLMAMVGLVPQRRQSATGRSANGFCLRFRSSLTQYVNCGAVLAKSHFRLGLLALTALFATGCSSVCCERPVQYAIPQPAPADIELQACANHAAAAAKESGQDFKRLRLDTAGRYKTPFEGYVGNTYVASVQDGYGQWFGHKEWRAVRYHCLTDNNGQVLYSFVRAE